MQLLCRVPTFQTMLRDAVDAANDNEDDEQEEYQTHEVEQARPISIEPKFLDEIATKKTKMGTL